MNHSGIHPAEQAPPLVAVAHGSTDPAGAAAIRRLIRQVELLRPELQVTAAFLSNGTPTLDDSLSALMAEGRAPIIVPLLLSSGYHVRHDIPGVVARWQGPCSQISVTPHLGPHALVIDILLERVKRELRTIGDSAARHGAHVVLAAAGSRDPQAAHETSAAAHLLSERLNRPVHLAYTTTNAPRLDTALEQTNRVARGGDVIVATYLLAPGEFERRIHSTAERLGAARLRVTASLAPDPSLARLVLERYDTLLTRRERHAAEPLAAADSLPFH
jgi:sirohydrochlorin ferrochelatase